MDLWSGSGPNVGVYPCNYAANEQWTYTPGPNGGSIRSNDGGAGNPCLVTDGASSEGTFMVDEFGNGELTFYGAFVTDYCVASC
jgi:hypothetical protein